jgi:putative membrane protein
MAEVKLGQLAQEKGSNQSAKDFGKKMVDEHSKANDELKETASKENITLPTDVSKSEQATYDRLSKLSGASFDRAYARTMVSDHQKDVAEFQKEATSGKNDALKNFAAKTAPTLQEHLKMARDMEQSVSQTSSKTTKTKVTG